MLYFLNVSHFLTFKLCSISYLICCFFFFCLKWFFFCVSADTNNVKRGKPDITFSFWSSKYWCTEFSFSSSLEQNITSTILITLWLRTAIHVHFFLLGKTNKKRSWTVKVRVSTSPISVTYTVRDQGETLLSATAHFPLFLVRILTLPHTTFMTLFTRFHQIIDFIPNHSLSLVLIMKYADYITMYSKFADVFLDVSMSSK